MEEEKIPQNSKNAVGFTREKRPKEWLTRAMSVLCALLFAAGCIVLGVLIGRGMRDEAADSLLWMIDAVEKNYREEVNREDLYDRLYDALALDGFCAHYTPEEYGVQEAEHEGQNTGYGLSLITENNRARISRVVENSPVSVAGLRRGMYVFAVGGTSPATSAEAVALLNAAEGEVSVSCGWEEDGSDARAFTVRRAAYRAAYCTYADSGATFRFRGESSLALTETEEGIAELPADTAYIALTQFQGNAAAEFEQCLEEMRTRGRKNLIIDLRGNGGGYLAILCDIAACLLRNAEGNSPLVAQARYRSGKAVNYCASGNRFSAYFDADSRISVLADENSASASEALMGALHDYGTCAYSDFYLRKPAGGTAKTYGKGVMQSHFTAPDGNVLLLTVANICWPQGKCIHGVGITENDGAVAVEAPSVCGREDVFLQSVCAALS